ncbi:MAG: AsnC family transcriptional regulator [Candidatus Altiarchaeota archaeon]
MDSLDIEIIKNLQENARKSLRDIGEKLDTPHTTIHSRLKKLESRGLIKDYAAIVNPQKMGLKVGYIILNTPPQESNRITSMIAEHPETMHVMRASDGKIIVKIIVEDKPDNKGITDYVDKLCDQSKNLCDESMQVYTVSEIVKYEHAIDEMILDKKKKR